MVLKRSNNIHLIFVNGSLASMYMLRYLIEGVFSEYEENVNIKLIYCSIDKKHRRSLDRITGVIKKQEPFIRIKIIEIDNDFEEVESWLSENYLKSLLNIDDINNLKIYIGLCKDNDRDLYFEKSISDIVEYPIRDKNKYSMYIELVTRAINYFKYTMNCTNTEDDYYCGTCNGCKDMAGIMSIAYSIANNDLLMDISETYYRKFFNKQIPEVQVIAKDDGTYKMIRQSPTKMFKRIIYPYPKR